MHTEAAWRGRNAVFPWGLRIGADTVLKCFLFCLSCICFFYFSYRYVMRYGDAGTSPTYVDTPFMFKVLKYFLVTALCGLSASVLLLMTKGRIYSPMSAAVFFYMALAPIGWGCVLGNVEIVKMGVPFVCGFVLHLAPPVRLDCGRAARFLSCVIQLFILVNGLQILLFIFWGRLPALAYANSYIVRFGSLLDDPNSFGLLVSLFWGFGSMYYRRRKRWVVLGALAVSLILTQSLTAIASFLGVAFVIVGSGVLKKRVVGAYARNVVVCSGVALVMCVLIGGALVEGFWAFLATKAGSIQAHLDSYSVIGEIEVAALLGVLPTGRTSEVGYLDMTGNLGMPYLCCFGILVWSCLSFFSRHMGDESCTCEGRAMANGFRWYLGAYAIALTNLPFQRIFSTSVLSGVCFALGSTLLLCGPARPYVNNRAERGA